MKNESPIQLLTAAFKQMSTEISRMAGAAAVAAKTIRTLHRNILLYIRHHYVEAGKPYGNGYAGMMRWWRQQCEDFKYGSSSRTRRGIRVSR